MQQRSSRKILAVSVAVIMGLALAANLMAVQNGNGGNSQSVIQRGLAISPVPVDLAGKNPALVAQGSYIVNTAGCSDCHTFPQFVDGGNPFLGEPEQMNTEGFLAGGTPFGPFISRNLTPDRDGLPAGLTLNEFIMAVRFGADLKALPPDLNLLQVMPWPVIGKHTDSNLEAIYEYLKAIPCVEGGPGMPVPPATRC